MTYGAVAARVTLPFTVTGVTVSQVGVAACPLVVLGVVVVAVKVYRCPVVSPGRRVAVVYGLPPLDRGVVTVVTLVGNVVRAVIFLVCGVIVQILSRGRTTLKKK